MKVAFIMGSMSRLAGGLLEANRHLLQGLHRRGDDVRLLSVKDAFTEADREVWAPVKTTPYSCHGPVRFGYAPEMESGLADFAPNVVHSQGLWTYSSRVSWRWRGRTGRPEVIHPHGMMDAWALNNSSFKKKIIAAWFERRHLQEASCLRALCQAELESMRAYGLSNPVCVIPNGIDLPPAGADFGTHPLLPRDRKVLLYLGRLHPKKGLENLVKAWAALSDRQGWILALAGWDEGGHEAHLKQLATAAGLTSADILFLGPQFGADKECLYASCDAFILPSFSEGLPMVVLEAWAHAKPVILTPMCHLPEGLAAGAAIEVQPELESLTGGLREMTALSETERRAMGGRGLNLVRRKFTWDHVVEQTRVVQEWLVHGGSQPDCVFA